MTKPTKSILDNSFRSVPAVATSVLQTWRRFGWQPTTDDERARRRRGSLLSLVPDRPSPAKDWSAQRAVSTAAAKT